MSKSKKPCPHDRQKIVVRDGKRIQICCSCKQPIGKPLK